MQTTQPGSSFPNDIEEKRRDDMLWQMAKRRAGFKYSLLAYIVVNLFLIGVWYYTNGPHSKFWPIWPLMGWGVGLAFQYYSAYHGDSFFSAEKEYRKMKNEE